MDIYESGIGDGIEQADGNRGREKDRKGDSRISAAGGWNLRCVNCGNSPQEGQPDYCGRCGHPVQIELDYSKVDAKTLFDGRLSDMWKYAPLYPLQQNSAPRSLGEGATPLVSCRTMGRDMGIADFRCKLDYLNPSGSFKDRGVAVGVAKAVETGSPAIVCASSGNAAGSAVTFASRAGLPAVIFVPEATPAPKLMMAMAYGARVFRVRGSYSCAFSLAREAARRMGWANVTTTYVNPYAVEGNKSVAYELYEQLGDAPDWVLIPVSAGPLLYGVWKGFAELRQFGLVGRIPRLAAIQPQGCAPLAKAFAAGHDHVEAWGELRTVVSGLSDPLIGYSGDGTLTLRLIRESGGAALALPDEAILQAARKLAAKEGIFAEPAGAAAAAGAEELRRQGLIAAEDRVVSLLTGHGLKQPVHSGEDEAPLVEDIEEVFKQFETGEDS